MKMTQIISDTQTNLAQTPDKYLAVFFFLALCALISEKLNLKLVVLVVNDAIE